MTTPVGTPRDPVKHADIDQAADPANTQAAKGSKPSSAATVKPVVIQLNENFFEHYGKHDWMRDFKPEVPATPIATLTAAPVLKAVPAAAPTTTAIPSATTTSLKPSSQPAAEKAGVATTARAKSDVGDYEEAFARPSPSYTVHQVASRPSINGPLSIRVRIGKLPTDLPPDENWFPMVLDVINRYTIQKPYACDPTQMLDVGDAVVFRPVHNVTHSTRQVRLQRALLDCLRIHGSRRVKELLGTISSTERMLLELASFCLRVGRVDETPTHTPFPDSEGRKLRSAQIFSLYASQLPSHLAPPDEIKWVASLVAVACTPDEALPEVITEDDKSYFAVQLLATAHELDLYRCYDKKAMQEPIQKAKQFLFIQTDDFAKADELH
ncbi:MAG: hypothetical protein EBV69_11505, partial [Oxalobacteraceae bacterium]|nr:hypothetical protein [Oxalobacteraceae bacterium]